jgi:hypothetical protein
VRSEKEGKEMEKQHVHKKKKKKESAAATMLHQTLSHKTPTQPK